MTPPPRVPLSPCPRVFFLLALLLALLLGSCADFWSGVARNREAWSRYRNSPAYYTTTYRHVYTRPDGGSRVCYVTVDDRTYDSETQCFDH